MEEKKENRNAFIVINEHRFEAVATDVMHKIITDLETTAKECGNTSPMVGMAEMLLMTMFAAKVHKALFDDDTARVETSGIDTSDLTNEELNDRNTDDEFTL